MGAIQQYVKNQAGRAWDQIQNFSDKFQAARSRVQGYLGTAFEVAKNGETFVGLQYSSIEKIRTAIRTYVTNVQNEVAKLNTEASNDNAVKGEVADATKAYVKAVSDVAQAYVSALLAYSDRMYEYGEEYKKSDTTLASNVNEEATALANSAETYTEKY